MVRVVRIPPEDGGAPLRALRWTFATRRAWVVAAALLLAYGALYLLVARALIVDPAAHFSRAGALPLLVPQTPTARSLVSWLDPLFVLYITDGVVLAPSVPALLTVGLVGALVGVNGAMAVETILRRPPACAGGGPWWVAAALPSFLASFSCCAPTLLLLVGVGAAGAVVSIVPFVAPLAGLLLLASVVWSARRLERTTLLAVR